MTATPKQVTFATTQTAYFGCPHYLTREERKRLCWYSESELNPCREDTKEALAALQEAEGRVDAVPADHCMRGIEKFADPAGKVRGQRMLIDSILQQQYQMQQQQKQKSSSSTTTRSSSDYEYLANLSRYLSLPFQEIAYFYAQKAAEELYPPAPPIVSPHPLRVRVDSAETIAREATRSKSNSSPLEHASAGQGKRECEESSNLRNVKQCVQCSE